MVNGWTSFVDVSTRANRNSFQTEKNVRTLAATIPGFARGRLIRRKTCQTLHPSIKAASSSDGGIESKKVFSTQTEKGMLMEVYTRIKPREVFNRCSEFSMEYNGIIRIAAGSMRVTNNKFIAVLFALKLYLENPNAAVVDNMMLIMVVRELSFSELVNPCGNLDCSSTVL